MKRSELIGKPIITLRNGKTRVGEVTSVGKRFIGLKVSDMATKTRIPNEELVPVTVYMTQEALDKLGFNAELITDITVVETIEL